MRVTDFAMSLAVRQTLAKVDTPPCEQPSNYCTVSTYHQAKIPRPASLHGAGKWNSVGFGPVCSHWNAYNIMHDALSSFIELLSQRCLLLPQLCVVVSSESVLACNVRELYKERDYSLPVKSASACNTVCCGKLFMKQNSSSNNTMG